MGEDHKTKRVIVHLLKADSVAGGSSKKGKATSDCLAVATLLGSSPLQKFSTKTVKKTNVKNKVHSNMCTLLFTFTFF